MINRADYSSEELQMIDEVVAQPWSDEARLIYADWLDEHGDSRGAYLRAEFSFASASSLAEASLGRDIFNCTPVIDFDATWIGTIGMKFGIRFHGPEHANLVTHYLLRIPAISCPSKSRQDAVRYLENEVFPKISVSRTLVQIPLSLDLIHAFKLYQEIRSNVCHYRPEMNPWVFRSG